MANQLKALRAATERHVPSEEHDDSDDEGDEPDTYHIGKNASNNRIQWKFVLLELNRLGRNSLSRAPDFLRI